MKCRWVEGGSRVAREYVLIHLLSDRLKKVAKECEGLMGCLISEYY